MLERALSEKIRLVSDDGESKIGNARKCRTYDLWNLWWDTKKWLFATQWYGYTRLPSIHIAMIGGD